MVFNIVYKYPIVVEQLVKHTREAGAPKDFRHNKRKPGHKCRLQHHHAQQTARFLLRVVHVINVLVDLVVESIVMQLVVSSITSQD